MTVQPHNPNDWDVDLANFKRDHRLYGAQPQVMTPVSEQDRELPGCIPDSFIRIASWWMARKQRRSL